MHPPSSQYNVEVHGNIQGLVQGDGNVVTFIYNNVAQHIPFLPPPRPPHGIVGRDLVIEQVSALLKDPQHGGVILFGLPGIGKTAIALEVSHNSEIRAHFSDGIIWAGLGTHPDVHAIMSGWALASGLSSAELSKLSTLEEIAAATHYAIGNRRMLLVVDDAWRVDDALAFLIGGPNCSLLLTTRVPEVLSHFPESWAFTLADLDDEQGLKLLARFVPALVETDREVCLALVRASAGLPLAIMLIGKRLRFASHSEQTRRVRETIALLQDATARLQLTEIQPLFGRHPSLPQPEVSLDSVIALSEGLLEEPARSAFRACSAFPPKPSSFSEEAALAVANVDPKVIDQLLDSGLVESAGNGRYRLHQVIYDYARSKESSAGPEERLVSYYALHVGSYTSINLQEEFSNIKAAIYAADRCRLSVELYVLLIKIAEFTLNRGSSKTLDCLLSLALDVDRHTFDNRQAAAIWILAGEVSYRSGEFDKSEIRFNSATRSSGACGHPAEIARLHRGLGWLDVMRGRYENARAHFENAVELATSRETVQLQGSALVGLGVTLSELGDYCAAESYLNKAIPIGRDDPDSPIVSDSLSHLGRLAFKRGDFAIASRFWTEGLELSRQKALLTDISTHLGSLAVVSAKQMAIQKARDLWREGLHLAQDIGHMEGNCYHLQNIGWSYLLEGCLPEANEKLTRALDLARKMNFRSQISFISANLALSLKDNLETERLISSSLQIASEIGRAWLTSAVACLAGEYFLRHGELMLASDRFGSVLNSPLARLHDEHRAFAQFGQARIARQRQETECAEGFAREALTYFMSQNHWMTGPIQSWISSNSLNQEISDWIGVF